MAIQFLRGSTAANDAYTGPEGSFTVDTEAGNIRIHNGVTPGGWVIAQGGLSVEEQQKFNAIEEGAQVNSITSVAGKIGEVELDQDDVGLGSVNNTSDNAKPVSALQRIALDAKVDKEEGFTLISNASLAKLNNIEAGAQVNAVKSVEGRTGDVELSKNDVGLSNVDNTADLHKPVSTPQSVALENKVDKIIGQTLIPGVSLSKLNNIEEGAQVNTVLSVDGMIGEVNLAGRYEQAKQNNLTATTDPTTSDDATEGYVPLSTWVNTTTGVVWTLLDATEGAARWEDGSVFIDDLGSSAFADVGTGPGTVAAGNDSRFTDAREWSAELVPQPEAELGEANTRRAWSARRVRQAITAWWTSVTSTFSRSFLSSTSAQEAHIKLELGNSVGRDVGTTVNTVAAGNDSRIVNAVPNSRTVSAGVGLTGGGALSSDTTLAVNFGTAINTVAAGNDSRIVNAVPNSRTVSAGTGLTGGGALSSNTTLAVNFGTSSGTVTVGNDSRLSNSREWTASTVSQAEAQAGADTTRRAWTAQRVRQAIRATFASGTETGGVRIRLNASTKVLYIRTDGNNA